MSLKKHFAVSFTALLLSAPFVAFAGIDLTINNQTNFDSASAVNGGLCSTKLPFKNNFTPRGQSNVISAISLSVACGRNRTSCSAVIYANKDCAQPADPNGVGAIGTAVINLDTGVQRVDITDKRFTETHDGTHVTLSCSADHPEVCYHG